MMSHGAKLRKEVSPYRSQHYPPREELLSKWEERGGRRGGGGMERKGRGEGKAKDLQFWFYRFFFDLGAKSCLYKGFHCPISSPVPV